MKQLSRKESIAVCFLFFFLHIRQIFAQDVKVPALPTPTAWAQRVNNAPVIDGEVENDLAYAKAMPLTEFWQVKPDDGQPASERTEVRVVYTSDTLYFGVICYDSSPSEIIVSENRRDALLDETDCVQILLDTYRDKQNGFIFGTNPGGLEYDAQITKEGELSMLAQTTGSTGGFNLNWDGSWEVRTMTGSFGWSAEFAIPFRTLRYAGSNPQTWGLNIQRNIRRRKETAFWSKIPRQFTINRVSYAGELLGLNLPIPKNLKFIPYALGKTRQTPNRRNPPLIGQSGFDMKYSVTPSLTLDGTINTDFAQVEVDEQQVNLDRFDLFFPEKRPFFLENAGVFDVGSPGEVELFFSRRIGIGPNGHIIPIVGGARLSGKIGRMSMGLMDMQTRSVEGVAPSNNFLAARVNQELPNRSALGALVVRRQGSVNSDYQGTVAADARWGIGEFNHVLGFLAKTFNDGSVAERHALKIGFSHQSPGWTAETHFTEVAPNFNPEVGFLRRRSYRKSESVVLRRYRPDDVLGLQELRPHISYRGFWNFTGFQETGFLHFDNHWEFKTGDEIHTGVNFKKDGVTTSFEIHPGIFIPAGTYDNTELQFVLRSNQGAVISTDGMYFYGGFFTGKYFSMNPVVKMRAGDRFNVLVGWNHSNVNLAQGSFTVNILRTRISYSFTPRMFLQGLFQTNDRTHTWSGNIRFGWLQSANTGLFIVVNELHEWMQGIGALQDRSVIVKYTHLFELLD
ncbi:MAG: carbohydrate binding family 9 domain-containing protein [Ignavibacteriales bacterium]|nr:carbohydrate binding family 9 domain-containing protein [Ignavibacteriales bacterium]